MKSHKLLILFFLLYSMQLYAHSDFWMIKTFGNVKVRIKTGFEYEEINKSWIIGELASNLCQRLSYKDTVFIDFNHYYTGHCTPDYFISFDNGTIIEKNDNNKPEPFFKQKVIVVREVSKTFDPCITLNLLEYAIRNLEMVKTTQRSLRYNKNYCDWKINSIDTSLVKIAANLPISAELKTTLETKIYRPKSEDSNVDDDFSYYFKDGKYHIYYKDNLTELGKAKDSILLVISNIYQFKKVTSFEAIVFETDDTFYFVRGVNFPYTSKPHTIQNNDSYQPYEIDKIGWDKITINFCCIGNYRSKTLRDATLLLNIKKDEVKDLDKLLENNK